MNNTTRRFPRTQQEAFRQYGQMIWKEDPQDEYARALSTPKTVLLFTAVAFVALVIAQIYKIF